MTEPDPHMSFETTHWSMVLAGLGSRPVAGPRSDATTVRALLVSALRIRSSTRLRVDQAQDVIQGFFLRLLENDVLMTRRIANVVGFEIFCSLH